MSDVEHEIPGADDDALRASLDAVRAHLADAELAQQAVERGGPRAAVAAVARPATAAGAQHRIHLLAAVRSLADAVEHQGPTAVQASRTATKRVGDIEATVSALRDDAAALAVRTIAAEAAQAEFLVRLGEVQTELGFRNQEIAALRHEVEGLRGEVGTARELTATVRAQQAVVLRTARQALADQGISVAQLTELSRELGTDHEGLYQELEDEFRGTRQEICDKLRPYLADVATLAPGGPLIDVGCGRGEWLELLQAEGVEAYGIDTNHVVVERCQARGLDVRDGDALVHLRELEPGSVRAVTSFHVVEHLGLDTLIGLIDAALVALRPGGLLVFETPNPKNLIVGAASFYLDPTHLKPLHPQFLEFLVRSRGFAQVEGRYLNGGDGPRLHAADLDPGADPQRNEQIVDLINGALTSPLDFGLVARKAAGPTSAEP